jgi:IS5 family transposase
MNEAFLHGAPDEAGRIFCFSQRQYKLLQTRDFLEQVNRLVEWELFRPVLESAIERKDSGKGGRLAFDLVLMFKILMAGGPLLPF